MAAQVAVCLNKQHPRSGFGWAGGLFWGNAGRSGEQTVLVCTHWRAAMRPLWWFMPVSGRADALSEQLGVQILSLLLQFLRYPALM